VVPFCTLRSTPGYGDHKARPFHPFRSIPAYRCQGDCREIVSRIIIDATTPYEWKEKPVEIFMDKKMIQQVLGRWKEFGFEDIGVFPTKTEY
jgi:hypothetical protein